MKVMLLVECWACEGEAMVYCGERTEEDGSKSPIYLPCHICKGKGEVEKPITLEEFQRLLDSDVEIKPDYAELSKEKPVSQYHDSRDAADT